LSIVLRKCAISGANTAVGENGVQSVKRLVCVFVPIIEIRDNSAKGTAKIVVCTGINKALIYKLCGKNILEINN